MDSNKITIEHPRALSPKGSLNPLNNAPKNDINNEITSRLAQQPGHPSHKLQGIETRDTSQAGILQAPQAAFLIESSKLLEKPEWSPNDLVTPPSPTRLIHTKLKGINDLIISNNRDYHYHHRSNDRSNLPLLAQRSPSPPPPSPSSTDKSYASTWVNDPNVIHNITLPKTASPNSVVRGTSSSFCQKGLSGSPSDLFDKRPRSNSPYRNPLKGPGVQLEAGKLSSEGKNITRGTPTSPSPSIECSLDRDRHRDDNHENPGPRITSDVLSWGDFRKDDHVDYNLSGCIQGVAPTTAEEGLTKDDGETASGDVRDNGEESWGELLERDPNLHRRHIISPEANKSPRFPIGISNPRPQVRNAVDTSSSSLTSDGGNSSDSQSNSRTPNNRLAPRGYNLRYSLDKKGRIPGRKYNLDPPTPTTFTPKSSTVSPQSTIYELVNPVAQDEWKGLKLKFRKSSVLLRAEGARKLSHIGEVIKRLENGSSNIEATFSIKLKPETPRGTKPPLTRAQSVSDAYKALQIAPRFGKPHPMGLKKPSLGEACTLSTASPSSSDQDGYDSDCLVIIEGDGDPSLENTEVKSDAKGAVSTTALTNDTNSDHDINSCVKSPKTKSHNLPIYELKKKLAYCSVCQVQHSSHKAANLCLSKHGKRQCWLCLEVMANSKDSYFQHCVRYHAVGPSSDIVGCPYCQKSFDFRQGFNQHIVKVHFSEDISFVSSTACLSPSSLVDLYTGQPRRQLSSNGNRIDLFENSQGSSKSESLGEIGFNPLNGVDGTVQFGNRRARTPLTRESVIRETPSSNLSNFKPPRPPPSVASKLSPYNNIITPVGPDHIYQVLLSHPPAKPQVALTNSEEKNSALVRFPGGEFNLNLPQWSNNKPSPFSHTTGNMNLLSRIDTATIPDSSSSSSSSTGSGSVESHDPLKLDKGSSLGSVSPSLLEMQRMVQSSQVQMQYFNSVNSMLRTVAECRLKTPGGIGPHSDEGNDTDGSTQGHSNIKQSNLTDLDSPALNSPSDFEVFKVPHNVGVKRRILTKWDEHQERQDEDSQPISPKIHRNSPRQEFHSMSIAAQSPSNGRSRPQHRSASSEDKNFWEQVIRESNAMYKGLNIQHQLEYPPEDNQSQSQSQCHDPVDPRSNLAAISQSNYAERSQHYPRIMARVDHTGRPIGMFTANGQPCVVSSNPTMNNVYQNQNHSDPMTQYIHSHQNHAHRQYQYKIIPQASPPNLNPVISQHRQQSHSSRNAILPASTNISGEYMSSRKRKSTLPTRVVPNPHYDNVVVQNPFEEEDAPCPSSKVRAPKAGVNPSYRYEGNLLEAARDQALAQWEALVRQQQQQYHQLQQNFITTRGRVHNSQSKFTTGGQITEFSCQGNVGHARGDMGATGIGTPDNSSNISRSSSQSSNSICALGTSISNQNPQQRSSVDPSDGQFQVDDQGNLSEGQLQSSQNSNSLGWPPFVVAPRYQENCHIMLSRLRDMERQRRVDIGVHFEEADI